MGRPPVKKGEKATSEKLLAAAEVEFALSGFSGARLADIARRVGIRRPSLLYHYPSKEELYKATVERAFTALSATLAQGMGAQVAFRERLKRITESFSEFIDGRPHLARLVLREFIAEQGPGRDILMSQVAPLLGQIEVFIKVEGADELVPGLPIRAAIMQSVSDILLKSASGELRGALWGEQQSPWSLVENSFFAR